MFGWFQPTCPVDPQSKRWIEERLAWLTEELGAQGLLEREVILPTPDYFPDPYDGSKKAAKKLLRRVCRYMDIEPDWVQIKFYTERKPVGLEGYQQGCAGLYAGSTIWIEESNLEDPMALVGTMSHELGHLHLLGEGRISDQAEDHEPLTDLFTVFMGLGIFTANSVLREKSWQAGQMAGWSMSKLGYLTMDMYGYAFALFAWYRHEEAPAWASHLRGDVHAAFKGGLKFLRKTGDALFRPPNYRPPQ
jgi:hypothetical protein